jgi:intracellular sulfur oxidation DsrE/DsrF family protein
MLATIGLSLSLVPLFASRAPQPAIPIDIPVPLTKADTVFNILHRDPITGPQTSLHLAKVLDGNLTKERVPHTMILVFHGDGAPLACDDATFKRLTGSKRANPYKQAIADLQKAGVQTEICVVAMEAQGISRNQLLPGIKVNAGALLRIIELTQKGYTQFAF